MHNLFDGFSKLSFDQRLEKLAEVSKISKEELLGLSQDTQTLSIEVAENLIENVIGTFSLPLGVATNFLIDGKLVPIPMVVEETSIIAAASASAKWVYKNGGFQTRALGRLMIGQVQFPSIKNVEAFEKIIQEHSQDVLSLANNTVSSLVKRGGGVTGFEVRKIERPDGQGVMAVLHIFCDPCDAMGANLVNQICETLKPSLEEWTQERVGLCILSNLVDTKIVEATCEIETNESLGKAIEEATLFANLDSYRAATHNKGVMNGIDPILIATGNDWRAVEAGVHAYAARSGKYQSITEWKYENGKLRGKISAPIAVGTVGGMTKLHPSAKTCLKMMGIEHSDQLARICAAVALAQNLGALKALCTEGIIRGHMQLHASNLALAAGAKTDELEALRDQLKKEKLITFSKAQSLLKELRASRV
ncbi:MAG: hydroxymethylglutaryl-CoA reductase, degradative [Bacteriovoracia bacterium]